MKVGLLGFGRTGKLVSKHLLQESSVELRFVVKKNEEHHGRFASEIFGLNEREAPIFSLAKTPLSVVLDKHPIDVLIDFSNKSSVMYYPLFAENGIKIVSAISNYDPDQLIELQRLSAQTAIVHSPNITIGVNALIGLAQFLQTIVPQADVEIVEEHFRDKKEISGTAVRIAKTLGVDVESHVSSVRAGGIVGRHEIIFGLANQTIRLTHESIDRASFAEGALEAARFLYKRKTGFYDMQDILGITGLPDGEHQTVAM